MLHLHMEGVGLSCSIRASYECLSFAWLNERLLFDSDAIDMMLRGDEGLGVFGDAQGHPHVMTEHTEAAVSSLVLLMVSMPPRGNACSVKGDHC